MVTMTSDLQTDPHHNDAGKHVSSQTFHIAGILTTVYGLSEIPPQATSLSCLWLHHPRLENKGWMEKFAYRCINEWNDHGPSSRQVGMIAVAFDQRNHGTREVSSKANGSWRDGNETHAQDMFSIIHGTVLDTSLLIDHLESYILNGRGSPAIEEHLVLGVSLGGHSAWQVLFNEPRVTTAVAVIGCPDYLGLISDRAHRSSRPSSSNFLNSPDYPAALISAVNRTDPKSLLFSTSPVPSTSSLTISDHTRLRSILDSHVKNKKILVQSGGVDKLVPYACSEPFLTFLKDAVAEEGWYGKDGGLEVNDRVYEGIGHKFSEGMVEDAVKYICGTVGRERKGEKPVPQKL